MTDNPQETVRTLKTSETSTPPAHKLVEQPRNPNGAEAVAIPENLQAQWHEIIGDDKELAKLIPLFHQVVKLNQEFRQNSGIEGGQHYHDENHSLAVAQAGIALIRQAEEGNDPLGLNQYCSETGISLKQLKRMTIYLGLIHDLGNLGFLTFEDDQINIDFHTNDEGKNIIRRQGIADPTNPGSTIMPEDIVSQISRPLYGKIFPDATTKELQLFKKMIGFTKFPSEPPKDQTLHTLFTFVQLIDQVLQARSNLNRPDIFQDRLEKEWVAETGVGVPHPNLTPEQMENFANNRFEQLVPDTTQREQINQILSPTPNS